MSEKDDFPIEWYDNEQEEGTDLYELVKIINHYLFENGNAFDTQNKEQCSKSREELIEIRKALYEGKDPYNDNDEETLMLFTKLLYKIYPPN